MPDTLKYIFCLQIVGTMKKINTPLLIILLFSFSPFINGQTAITPQETEVGIIEHLDEYLPGDIMLIDENEDTVSLENLIDKPTIINLVYFRCPGICSPLMEGLAEVMGKVDLELGKDYQVLTISFDPREAIDLAHRKKNNYLNLMAEPAAAETHWKFFVSDSASIDRLTDAVGFKYKKAGNDFLHAATIVIVSPDGKITRYLNGTFFLPFEVTMAITEASKGISAPTVNRILQFCFAYDPVGQKYVMSMTRVGFIVIMLTAVVVVALLSVRFKKQRKTNQA